MLVSNFQFVAHASCQKKLTTYWYGDFFRYFRKLPNWAMSLNAFLVILFYPLLIIIYWFAPNSKVSVIYMCSGDGHSVTAFHYDYFAN